ncbi:JNK1/MAPK8-associated membrane protein [Toxocara canis]|uniref:JNK1/MAPK8-associated membrane protein n=1 Tax=Toxocara canis TaxID=6265 RepID=A0A0B2UV28_TOXCA|nr:JNK1/MAPK8-associated membrane protein [Toxocara canis]
MVDDGSGVRKLASSSRARVCPAFCGRIATTWPSGNITYSDCQACGWGSRSIEKYLCTPCEDPLPLYDWLYLTFVAVVPLLLHSFFIHLYAPKTSVRSQQVAQHVCCLAECVLSGVLSVALMPPRGSLSLNGCTKSSIREWYPMFYNPVINHTHILRCNYEVVFPLYSLPFIYLAFCLVWLVVLRSVLYATFLRHSAVSSSPYYAALYSIPLLALTHALFAGLLYYSFAWVTLLCSVAVNAVHMAVERGTRLRTLCVEMLSRARNLAMLFVHMALFGFSLFALVLSASVPAATSSTVPPSVSTIGALAATLLLVPLPSIFYLLTVGLTNPAHVLDAS